MNSTVSLQHSYDVVVIGGGAAGLAAAVALGRSLRSVLVVDAGRQRNLPADHAHNVLGNEGVAPRDLLAAGRAEARGYGVAIVDDTVVDVRRDARGFVVDREFGPAAHAHRIVLATGLVDVLPDVPGLADGWGRTVLHCPYCHGYEVRGRRIGVIASNAEQATHQALLFARLSDRIAVFADTVEFTADQRADLAAMGVAIVAGPLDRVDVDGREVTAVCVAGTAHAVDAVVVAPRFQARTELFASLGGVPDEHAMGRFIPSDPTGRTPVDGVWAAGNAADTMAMVMASAASGTMTGAALNADLIAEEVAATRAATAESE